MHNYYANVELEQLTNDMLNNIWVLFDNNFSTKKNIKQCVLCKFRIKNIDLLDDDELDDEIKPHVIEHIKNSVSELQIFSKLLKIVRGDYVREMIDIDECAQILYQIMIWSIEYRRCEFISVYLNHFDVYYKLQQEKTILEMCLDFEEYGLAVNCLQMSLYNFNEEVLYKNNKNVYKREIIRLMEYFIEIESIEYIIELGRRYKRYLYYFYKSFILADAITLFDEFVNYVDDTPDNFKYIEKLVVSLEEYNELVSYMLIRNRYIHMKSVVNESLDYVCKDIHPTILDFI